MSTDVPAGMEDIETLEQVLPLHPAVAVPTSSHMDQRNSPGKSIALASRPNSLQSSHSNLELVEWKFVPTTSNQAVTKSTTTVVDANGTAPQESEGNHLTPPQTFSPMSEPFRIASSEGKLHKSSFNGEDMILGDTSSQQPLPVSPVASMSVHTKKADDRLYKLTSGKPDIVAQIDSPIASTAGGLRDVLSSSTDKDYSSSSVLPCRRLPIVEQNNNVEYVGRTLFLQSIASVLLPVEINEPKRDRTKAFAIIGTAGQGKTQTALQFAVRNKEFFQVILWARADKDHKILQDFAGFAITLGILAKTTNNLWEDARALVRWFELAGIHRVAPRPSPLSSG